MDDRPVAAPRPREHAWAAFVRMHLHDYNPAATRLWLAIALTGAITLVAAGISLAHADAAELWQLLGWITMVAIAAGFPLPIPRTKHSIATGDTVVFLLLALYGAPAAALAAGLEGLIGAMRTTKRLSSRIATLASNAGGMTIAGLVFGIAESWMTRQGLPGAAAHMGALALAAGMYFVASTVALMQIVYLKRGMRLTVREWFDNTSWVGTVYLVCAVVAGLLSLNAQQFGRTSAAMGVLVIGASLMLLRAHFRHQISEHEAQEARVEAAQQDSLQNQRRFHSAFTSASIGMAIVSRDGEVVRANAALCQLLGYAEDALQQRAFLSLLHAGDAALLERHVANVAARRTDTFSIELRCIAADRRETWVSLHCALFGDETNGDAGLIYQLHDITSRRRAEGELRHIAYHDSLTDLANRSCFKERLSVAVERGASDRRYSFAVMVLDLDRFKLVNDTLGHPAGDELLKEVARRLNTCVRPTDLVARLGGDEFAILLEETREHADALYLGQRLLHALDTPVSINGTELRPLASIGITFSDIGHRDPDAVLRDADLAMYKAKADGKARVAIFDASLREQLGHRLQLEADLRRAIGEGQLSLAFQPLYGLQPHRLTGFEALARWVHPVRGVISPGVFVPLAEETGCIEALTRWAIEESVRQLAVWRRELPASRDLVMHVNVSSKDLVRTDLVPHVQHVLAGQGVPAKALTLEITESMLMEQRDRALQALSQLSALGVKLSIDDFGTGYSSLAYLTTLPFDCLKIDRSFVIGMHKSPQNVEIVRTVLSLGRTLNKQVIAEGIETVEQLERLQQLGAPIGQGYLLSRPLGAQQAGELLRHPVSMAA